MLATAEAKGSAQRAQFVPRWWPTSAPSQHAIAVTGLLLAPLLVFAPGLLSGQVFYGKDTLQFYFPLTEWFVAQLKSGFIPLWLPHIFGGYPIFADGEIGMAHPLVLLSGLLLSAEGAVNALRYIHFALAGILTYWFCAVLGLRPLGASIAGLVFAFGSFLVGHLQHDNILRSAVWLPALLALVELALRSAGRARLRYALLGGLVVGIQLVGVHVQPVLISLLAAAGWVLVGPLGPNQRAASPRGGGSTREIHEGEPPRPLGEGWGEGTSASTSEVTSPSPQPSPKGRGGLSPGPLDLRWTTERLLRFWIWAVIVLVGLAVAAAQMIPLLVLSGLTVRGAGVNYYVSTSYAISPPELLTLIFPYFFRAGPEQHWSLWPPQETTLYVGVLPLVLACVAILFVRGKLVGWLVLGSLVHLWLALGDYAAPNPYYWLWNLPGFSVMRAPARFSLVIMLTAGVLAGLGADWLAHRSRTGFTSWQRFGLRSLACAWIGLLVTLLGIGGTLRTALDAAPDELLQSINFTYLTFRREMQQLGAPNVLAGMAASVDLNNPATQRSLVWLALAPLALLAWTVPRRWGAGRELLLISVVAADLLTFAGAFYPQAGARELHIRHPAIQELVARNGQHQVLVDPGIYHIIGANQLIHHGVSTAGGYSSLEPSRLLDYWWAMIRDENVLLDLFNVRYVVLPRLQSGSLMFNETRFHPAERLLHGTYGNPSGSESFRGHGLRTDRLTVISAVDGLSDPVVGETVAEIVVTGRNGEQRQFGLRYGLELTGYRRGAPNPTNALWAYYGPAFVPNGPSFPVQLSGAVLHIDPPLAVERIDVVQTAARGVLMVQGLGLRDAETFATRTITSADRLKYQTVYEDVDISILENRQALPKVFLASGIEPLPVSTPTADDIASARLDPRRVLIMDGASSDTWVSAAGAPERVGQAELLAYSATQAVARVNSPQAGYIVLGDRYDTGWRAWVDSQEVPVVRANAVLRAAPVPAGEHVVEFRYEPWWVPLGVGVSGLALFAVLIAVAFTLRPAPRAARPPAPAPA